MAASPVDHPKLATPPEGVSALRKARWRLIPLLAICYGVAYIDRVNISFASLQMNRDLHFSAAVYGFGAGIFFLSYAACEIPSNLMLLRFGARRWLSRIMVTWGFLAIAMIFVRTPHGFYAARFLLGMAEAGFFPGVMYYLTLWFPRETRAKTVSSFYVALPLSGTVMGSLAGWLLNLQGTFGLAGWQWLFLVEGAPAALLGVLLFFVLPNGPEEARWLSAEERRWLVRRLEDDRPAVAERKGHGLAAVLRNGSVWQLGLFELIALTVLYAYSFTAPLMLRQATTLSTTKIGWVVAALGLVGGAAMLGVGWLADRGNGMAYILGCTGIMSAGCAGVGLAHSGVALMGALALIAIGFYGMQGPFWAVPASFLSGEAAAAGLALITMLGIFGGFIGPYGLGVAMDLTGNYRGAMLILAGLTLSSLGLLVPLARRNRSPKHSGQRPTEWPASATVD